MDFFDKQKIPYWSTVGADELAGNLEHDNSVFVFAEHGSTYLIYYPNPTDTLFNLQGVEGTFTIRWFNPRGGMDLQHDSIDSVMGGKVVDVGKPPKANDLLLADQLPLESQDWLVIVRKES